MKARNINRKIEALGGVIVRQRGSHRIYSVTLATGVTGNTTVPQHTGDLPKGTLHAIEKNLEKVLGKGWLK